LAAVAKAERAKAKLDKEKSMSDQQKYVKISVIIDDGETTSTQTFYRAKEVTYGMDYVGLDPRDVVMGVSFKAEFDQEKDCVSTTESFENHDGALYIRRGDVIRKLGL
jgi:hypothetical protein